MILFSIHKILVICFRPINKLEQMIDLFFIRCLRKSLFFNFCVELQICDIDECICYLLHFCYFLYFALHCWSVFVYLFGRNCWDVDLWQWWMNMLITPFLHIFTYSVALLNCRFVTLTLIMQITSFQIIGCFVPEENGWIHVSVRGNCS